MCHGEVEKLRIHIRQTSTRDVCNEEVSKLGISWSFIPYIKREPSSRHLYWLAAELVPECHV